MSEKQASILQQHVNELCERAQPAKAALRILPDEQRQAALEAIALALEAASDDILSANAKDLARSEEFQLSNAMIDRLRLDTSRLAHIVSDLRAVAAQEDPVGRILEERNIVDDIQLQKVSVPIGVIVIIFESRPNVTVDAAALCVRSGNACILRGGKEAVHSNRAFIAAIQTGLQNVGIDPNAVQLVQQQERELIPELLARDDALDLVVPRGGEGLIKAVCAVSRIPVVKHDKGVCSIYVHKTAELEKSLPIIINAKAQRPGVCNAIENLLIDKARAQEYLPVIVAALRAAEVECRGDEAARAIVDDLTLATAEDWDTEYLELILSIKIVDGIDEAIAFTNTHGSQHSDSILCEDATIAQRYLNEVDSACVYHNASTRFTDGSQFQLGAEVGISTNRLHARGPMGVGELCTYKYILRGTGQIRS